MKKHNAKDLISRYHSAEVNEEERRLVEGGFLQDLNSNSYVPNQERINAADQRISANLHKHISGEGGHSGTLKIWSWIGIAASILLIGSLGIYFYKNNSINTAVIVEQDVAPGGNKAYLTLSDGKKLDLTEARNGELAKQNGTTIRKAKDGQLVYDGSNTSLSYSTATSYNTIEVPRAGQYQLRLPDGSKVWLNAASTLKFPPTFADVSQRKVELSGEAYFEIAKDKSKPFIVKTAKQEVRVLGTHFVINSYNDEKDTKTTLLEGSVRVEIISPRNKPASPILLKPGQQAVLNAEGGKVVSADIETEMAWKNEEFIFRGENIQSIMRKLSRWYDIDVRYKGNASELAFYGVVSRTRKISSVLKLMENTGNVKFKIEGKTVIVSK